MTATYRATISPTNGNNVQLLFPDSQFRDVVDQFKAINNNYVSAKHMGAALKIAIKPGTKALRKNTPKGPTGNLKRAIATKVVKYWKQDYGWAAALTGYRRSGKGDAKSFGGGSVMIGKDRAYHQGFLEFGTRQRRTKSGNIASSYNWRGPFKLEVKESRKRGPDGKYAKFMKRQGYRQVGKVSTVPKYPKAFFKSVPEGETVDLKYMPLGGTQLRKPPIRFSFNQALPAMRALMNENMRLQLQKAINEVWGRSQKGY